MADTDPLARTCPECGEAVSPKDVQEGTCPNCGQDLPPHIG
ncbi:MAG: hypothetical protein ACRDI3_00865 [Actinomycetota bacterium]